MRFRNTAFIAVGIGLFTAACSATPGTRTARPNANLLTVEEVSSASVHEDAFSLVRSLRPQWLRVRGLSSSNSSDFVKVYLDGSFLGGTDYLRQIPTRSISTIQYFDGLEATQRWGMDHGGGAILVSTFARS